MSSPPRPPTTSPIAVPVGAPDPGPGGTVPGAEVPAGVARDRRAVDALVALAGALAPESDVLDLMGELTGQAVGLLAASAAGALLVDPARARGLTLAAASSTETRLHDVLAAGLSLGPGVECVRHGASVSSPVIEVDAARWPRFARAAVGAGYRAVHVLPMRRRGEVVGALTLLHDVPHTLGDDDRRLGQTLADAATVGLLSRRAHHRAETVAEQLQQALHRRVVIEQAAGVLAQARGLGPDEARAALRAHARDHGPRLSLLCRGIVEGTVDPARLAPPVR